MMSKFLKSACALMILAGPLVATAPVAHAIEKPKYTVVMEDEKFEFREYPSMLIAEVTVKGDRKEAANKAFKQLAGFIFGDNQARTKMAMTAPVTQRPADLEELEIPSEKIAMTAPVTQTQTEAGVWVVNFMMPAEYSRETLPVPDDKTITIRETEPYKAITIRFKGKWKTSTMERRTKQLENYAASKGLKIVGPPDYAFYDPPFMPGFMRRNEVHFRLAE